MSSPKKSKKITDIKRKKKKKPNVLRFEDFRQVFFMIYSFLFFLLIFGVIFFNFQFFMQTYDKITEVINFTEYFKELYVTPASAITLNRICMREKIIDKNTIFQQERSYERELELFTDLKFHLNDLDKTIRLLPLYSTFKSQNDLLIKKIIYGAEDTNICLELFSHGKIDGEERDLCLNVMDGSFHINLISALNFLKTSLNQENDLVIPIDYKDVEAKEDQKKKIKEHLFGSMGVERIFGQYFLQKAFDLLNSDLEIIYHDQMLIFVNNLQVINLAISIFTMFILFIVMFLLNYYLLSLHRAVMFVFDIIPFDKMINDEQTIFLIKQYYKE
jgi:hypothetical protein